MTTSAEYNLTAQGTSFWPRLAPGNMLRTTRERLDNLNAFLWKHADLWMSLGSHTSRTSPEGRALLDILNRFSPLYADWMRRYRIAKVRGAHDLDIEEIMITPTIDKLAVIRARAVELRVPVPRFPGDPVVSGLPVRRVRAPIARMQVGSSADDPMFSAYRAIALGAAAELVEPFVVILLRPGQTSPFMWREGFMAQENAARWWSAIDWRGILYGATFENEGRAGTGKPRRLGEYFPEGEPPS